VTRRQLVVELAAITVAAALALGSGVGHVAIASGYRDPIVGAGAQDEAVYAHEAIRMARGGDWTTPIFLGRLELNKPPLLMWCGAASMSVLGIDPFALRLPVVFAGALCCALVYLWLRETRSLAAAVCAVMLLAFDPLFHAMSRKFMTDVLLLLFLTSSVMVLFRDPRLERWWSPVAFGVLTGMAIMTKSAGGLLLPAILMAWFAMARPAARPRARGTLIACAFAALVAAPWHIYQLLVHRDWFLAEYVGMQLLQAGFTGPERLSHESTLWFYIHRMLAIDPVLLLLALSALPWAIAAWNKEDGRAPRLLASWSAMACLGLAGFGSRIAYYLLPLIPALVLLSAEFSPLFRGRGAVALAAVLAMMAGVKAWSHDRVWGVDYRPGSTVRSMAALDRYHNLRRPNELVVVNADDEFYSAVLDLPRVRYLWVAPPVEPPPDYRRLGILMSVREFCRTGDVNYREFAPRLQAMHFPDASSIGTTIEADSTEELAEAIACSPSRDFFLPDGYRPVTADGATHTAGASENGRFFLFANR